MMNWYDDNHDDNLIDNNDYGGDFDEQRKMTEEVENEDKNNVDYKRENTDYDDDDRRYWMQRKCIMWLLMWYTW